MFVDKILQLSWVDATCKHRQEQLGMNTLMK